jgi:hypothetical protein
MAIITLGSVEAFSADLSSAPSAAEWFRTIKSLPNEKNRWIHRIAFIEKIEGTTVSFLSIDRKKFEKDTFFELISPDEASYQEKLNKPLPLPSYLVDLMKIRPNQLDSKKSFTRPEDYFQELFQNTYVDLIIYGGKSDKRWTFYTQKANKKFNREFTIKAPDDFTETTIKSWLLDKIGYSGIILATKKNYLLVAAYKKLKKDANGLIIGDSSGTLRIKGSKIKGDGLLRLVHSDENICVFEILIAPAKQVVKGTKLIL